MDQEHALELRRQGFHFVLGILIAAAVYFLQPMYGNLIIIPLMASIATMLIIPRLATNIEIAHHLLYHFERENDKKTFPFKGAIFFGIGVIPPMIFLDVNTACAVIAVLAAGDSFSTVVGKFHGKHRIKNKSYEGFAAFIISAAIFASIFTDPKTAITLAVLGGIIELFASLDDNIAIPWGLTIIVYASNIIAQNAIF